MCNLGAYVIATYIYIDALGTWWSKPTQARPTDDAGDAGGPYLTMRIPDAALVQNSQRGSTGGQNSDWQTLGTAQIP